MTILKIHLKKKLNMIIKEWEKEKVKKINLLGMVLI